MTHLGLRREDASGSPRRRLLSAILVVALLLCHGALGALHEVSWPAAPEQAYHAAVAGDASPAQGHPQGHPQEEHSQDQRVGHPMGSTDYAAALFAALLLGTVLALLLGGFPPQKPTAELLAIGRVCPPPYLPPPRGPTAPVLQVFRL